MYYFSGSEEFYSIVYVGIIGKAKDVIVCCTCFLFCRQIFGQVSDYVALDADSGSGPRCARGKLRVYAGSVVNKICLHARSLNFFHGHFSSELMNNSCNHLKVPQLLSAYIGIGLAHHESIDFTGIYVECFHSCYLEAVFNTFFKCSGMNS